MRVEITLIIVLHTTLVILLVSYVSATLSRTDAKKKDSKTQEPEVRKRRIVVIYDEDQYFASWNQCM